MLNRPKLCTQFPVSLPFAVHRTVYSKVIVYPEVLQTMP